MKTPPPRSLRLLLALTIVAVSAPTIALTAPDTVAVSALRDPEKNSAIKPAPRDAAWIRRHEGFVEEAKRGGIDLLFLGDSITDFWRRDQAEKQVGGKMQTIVGGRPVWDREFAPLHAANFGISADRTQHVLWRLDHGEIDGIKPKLVVLMIGTNNTGFENDKTTPRNTPAEAAEGVATVVRELRAKLPRTKILLLAIFPRDEMPDGLQRRQVDEINRTIAKLADGGSVRFLDIGPKFLAGDGALPKDIMPDFLHPSQKGYEIEAAAIKPVVLEMMK